MVEIDPLKLLSMQILCVTSPCPVLGDGPVPGPGPGLGPSLVPGPNLVPALGPGPGTVIFMVPVLSYFWSRLKVDIAIIVLTLS